MGAKEAFKCSDSLISMAYDFLLAELPVKQFSESFDPIDKEKGGFAGQFYLRIGQGFLYHGQEIFGEYPFATG